MKKHLLILLLLAGTTLQLAAQTSKTVSPAQAGTLKTYFTSQEISSVNSLTLKGKIDARDFAFLRDDLKSLVTLDMTMATISAYTGTAGTLTGESYSYPANEIPDYAFYNPMLRTYKSGLTSVSFPVSATTIGTQAFYFCWNLGAVTLPANLKKIKEYAFYGCYALDSFTATSSHTRFSTDNGLLYNKSKDTLFLCPNAKTGNILIPGTVKHIDKSAFENCYNLSTVTLPSTLISTGSYAFAYCSGITNNLTLPVGLKSLGEGAFYGCYNLDGTVNIPASLNSIGSFCFFESNSIRAFSVNSSNQRFSTKDGMLVSKNVDTLFICPGGKSGIVTIPATIKLIGSYSFYGCNKLTGTLTIPQLVDYIGYYAFYGCTAIQQFQVTAGNNFFRAENGILYSKTTDRLLACPTGYSGNFILPSTLVSIDPGAFSNCTSVSGNLLLPPSLSWIGAFAFYNCPGISGFEAHSENPWFSTTDGVLFNKNADTLYICPLSKTGTYTVPQQVVYIGESAFTGCVNLTEIKAFNNLQTIAASAFSYCSSLLTVDLPATVSTIQDGAFYYCSSLSRFNIATSQPPLVGYYTFDQANQQNATLTVPTTASTGYKNTPYWNNFSLITEQDFSTSLYSETTDELHIFNAGNTLVIKGTTPGKTIKLYNTAGKSVSNTLSDESVTSLHFPWKGIFILHYGEFVRKIIR